MQQHPVEMIPRDALDERPRRGIGLCLSGGGYRAMLFHLGSLWRLYETGILERVDRVSSVSGGSITAGVLGLQWKSLSFAPGTGAGEFVPRVVERIRRLASETIGAEAIVLGIALPGRICARIAAAYDRHLFRGVTLQDLPDAPRFVINATNVQSGALWRFSKPYMRDYGVGEVKNPALALSQAVAASSAFPPALSPMEMRLDSSSFTPGSGMDLQRRPFTARVLLTDGGVYDNLGLETVWKKFETVLVSDGDGKLAAEEEPKTDWGRHAYRVLGIIDNQVRSLRVRDLIASYGSGIRKGAYWGIRTDIANYGLDDPLPCPFPQTTGFAHTATRLKRLDDTLQDRIINWGYGLCDAALRKHVEPALQRLAAFPYPASGV